MIYSTRVDILNYIDKWERAQVILYSLRFRGFVTLFIRALHSLYNIGYSQ